MNHEQIEAIASVLSDVPSLTEVEVRLGTMVLRLRRAGVSSATVAAEVAPATPVEPVVVLPAGPKLDIVRAGVVGVFHSLGGKPTGAGDSVKAKQVLGHIETMRLMNDCTSPCDGVIERVLVQDGQPVEWGQPLFEIVPGGSK
jgi:acetyl-CoA carboxylase biotin carboxyl carrier protein